MSIRPEEMIRAKALAAAPVSALVGARIYAQMAPEKGIAWPFIVTGIDSQSHPTHMGGASGGGLSRNRIRARRTDTAERWRLSTYFLYQPNMGRNGGRTDLVRR